MSESADHGATIWALLLILFLLGAAVVIGYLLEHYKIYYIPESAASILLGAIVGAIMMAVSEKGLTAEALSFNKDIFFLLLLPPIIFESGYAMKRRNFFKNIGTILLLAVFGTIISTFFVGYMTYWAQSWGFMGDARLTQPECLLFGCLISAIDPVATLAIFSTLNASPLLYSLVFGESVLNDAVAITLFRTILTVLTMDDAHSTNTTLQTLEAVGDFFLVVFGSVAIGVALGVFSAIITKYSHLRSAPAHELGLIIITAMVTYLLSEALHLSGIMSIFAVGIIMTHYTHYNLSEATQATAKVFFRTWAHLSETFVFVFLGIAVFAFNHDYHWGLIGVSIVFCFAGRLLNSFPIASMANIFRKKSNRISLRHIFMLWFSGLRGAIAFALAMQVPTVNQPVILTTTLVIVMFTVIIIGSFTPLMLRLTSTGGPPASVEDGVGYTETDVLGRPLLGGSLAEITRLKRGLTTKPIKKGFMRKFLGLDRRVIHPFLSRKYETRGRQQREYEMMVAEKEAALESASTVEASSAVTPGSLQPQKSKRHKRERSVHFVDDPSAGVSASLEDISRAVSFKGIPEIQFDDEDLEEASDIDAAGLQEPENDDCSPLLSSNSRDAYNPPATEHQATASSPE